MEIFKYDKINVKPIKIPTPFLVGDVWAYLLESDGDFILVDCGPKTQDGLSVVHEFLKKEGVHPHQIRQIWLTHAHPDHHGAAKVLAEECQAEIVALHELVPYVEQTENYAPFTHFFEEHGIPTDWITNFEMQYNWFKQFMDPILLDDELIDGDVIHCGTVPFKVHHMPGHAWGHAVFECLDEAFVIAGDVLIEHISSNALIAFNQETGEKRNSLLDFRTSMKQTADFGKRIFSGHGNSFENPEAIWHKHDSSHQIRKKRIYKLLDKPMTLLEITQAIFPFAKEPKLAYLPISEVVGYLDWLLVDGMIQIVDEHPIRYGAV